MMIFDSEIILLNWTGRKFFMGKKILGKWIISSAKYPHKKLVRFYWELAVS